MYKYEWSSFLFIQNTSDVEEHPVNIDQAMVDIAYDYIKKKNVFRLCTVDGDDYLFNVRKHWD